jgi:hypothetical protein
MSREGMIRRTEIRVKVGSASLFSLTTFATTFKELPVLV